MRKLLKERDLPQGHRDTEAEEILMGDTPGDLYGCEYKGVAGEGICKFLKTKGDKNRTVSGSCEDGMVAGEVRRARVRGIGGNVEVDPSTLLGVNDSRRGTRGQLVGGTVEVQLARSETYRTKRKVPLRGYAINSSSPILTRYDSYLGSLNTRKLSPLEMVS